MCFASDPPSVLFTGAIKSGGINVRSDSNTSSEVICKLDKEAIVDVISEKYDWYKIKLPKSTVCYVKKTMVDTIDHKTGKISKENVNVRLGPGESFRIIGKADMNEVVSILADSGEWYRIGPTENTFGWVNKKFVNKTYLENTAEDKSKSQISEANPLNEPVILEGIIQPYGKVINRIATHKLITKEYDVYFLKGNPDNLNPLTYHRVRVTGKSIPSPKQKYPAVEIIKMEALD